MSSSIVSSVDIRNLQAAARHTDRAARLAAGEDGKLEQSEAKGYGAQGGDAFEATAATLETFRQWAQTQPGSSKSPTVMTVQGRLNAALDVIGAKDTEEPKGHLIGAELAKAQKLSTFRALNDVAERALPATSGMAFLELRERSQQISRTAYTSPAEVPAELASLIIDAANESTYASTTLEDVFSQVDASEVIVREMRDPKSELDLIAVDYGAGDSTYGAIFEKRFGEKVAAIKDHELYPA